MRPAPVVLLALSLLMPACFWRTTAKPSAPPRVPPPVARPVAPPAAEPVAPPAPPVPSPAAKAYASGSAALAHGNFESALEAFTVAWRESPGYAGVVADFPVALAGLKKSADDAARAGQCEEAGKRYAAVLRYLQQPAAARGKPLAFGRADVKAGMDHASDVLMERGLAEYRRGNLDGAVVRWRAILSYDPSHEEASKSVRTVQTQRENLKKFPPPR